MPLDARALLEASPYAVDLGVRVERLDATGCALSLPWQAHHSNGLGLHGGVHPSLASLAAHAVMRQSARTADVAPLTLAFQINYVRAVREQTVTAVTRVVRRTRDLGFFETTLLDASGAAVAHAIATVAERGGATAQGTPPRPLGDAAVPMFNEAIGSIPFLTRRGLRATGASPGQVELLAPASPSNLDGDGRLHEGVLLTLMDAAGAICPWTHTLPAPGSFGLTVALQAQLHARLPAQALRARATELARDGLCCNCALEVVGAEDGRRYASGAVTYRFGG